MNKKLATLFMILLFSVSFAVIPKTNANTMVIDGNLNDWAGIFPIVTDPIGDASSQYGDIVSAYVTSDSQNLYFRVDLSETTINMPSVNLTLRTPDGSLYLIMAPGLGDFTYLCIGNSLTEDCYSIIPINPNIGDIALSLDEKSIEFSVHLVEIGNPQSVDIVFWTLRPTAPFQYDKAPDSGYVTYEIGVISQDMDMDGILNDVDADPLTFSNAFNDIGNGGSTWGSIISRGDQILTIKDEPATSEKDFGLRITADPSGGAKYANISICDSSIFMLGPGDEIIVTYGSVRIEVINGVVEATFIADDATIATAELSEGTDVVFEPASSTFTNIGEIDATVKIDNVEYSIPAGNEWFTSSLELEPNTLNLKSKGNYITAFIELPSAIDINDVEISSITLQVKGYSYNVDLSASTRIGDYNCNGVSDIRP